MFKLPQYSKNYKIQEHVLISIIEHFVKNEFEFIITE